MMHASVVTFGLCFFQACILLKNQEATPTPQKKVHKFALIYNN